MVRQAPFPTGPKVQPYLPELMECMLQPLRNPSSPQAKELAVSALGAIGEEMGQEAGHGAHLESLAPTHPQLVLSCSHSCPGLPAAPLSHHHGAPAGILGDRP